MAEILIRNMTLQTEDEQVNITIPYQEANAIVKSTDDAKLDDEARKAFGIEYQTYRCLFCGRNVKCKMASPTVKKCNFYFPHTEIESK